MLIHPQFDPVAIEFGIIKIHWYGVMYVFGFLAFLWRGKINALKNKLIRPDQVEDLLFWGAMGVVLGGRIGYVVFYNFDKFLHDPLFLFQIYNGGMSFHGGLIGVTTSMFILSKKWKMNFFQITDFIAPLVPIGLGFGRIGNFINGELWGKATDLPWAMVFPAVDNIARHPSQLYQATLEGVLLFIILRLFSNKTRYLGQVSGMFALWYGIFRFLVEFVREPDSHIGYLAFGWLTMGQLLSLPMVCIGIALLLSPLFVGKNNYITKQND